MKLLILLTLSQFGLCQDSIGASVDIIKPNPGLRDCTLPREFTVSVRTHNDSVTLQLETSTSVKKTTPVYVSRQDEKGNPIIVRDTVLELEGTAEYQDVTHMANIEVSCVIKTENQPNYIFEGLLLLSGPRMYELKPTGTDSAASDIRYALTSSPVLISPIDNDDGRETYQSGRDRWMMASESLRKKRQIQEPIYVDVITVIGFSVYKRWFSRATQLSEASKHQETKQGLKRYFAHLMNGVDLRYKTASPLYNINLVGYIIEDKQSEQPFQSAVVNETKIDGDKLLEGTSQWKDDTPGFPDNDHVVVFTAKDLISVEENGDTADLLGYAGIGTICDTPYDSVSAVEYSDNLVDDMLVTTHEVGHALSALHDGQENTCNSTYQYVMSGDPHTMTQVLDHNNYYVFSTCSLQYFQTFIQGILTDGTDAQRQCLQTSLEPASVTNITGTMPGQLYDVHTQCQMMFGPGFVLRSDIDIGNSENICKRMVCGKDELESSRSAAEGTSCGNKKWCVAGQCVFSIDAPEQKNTDCLFGNQPIVYPENETCAEFIRASPHLCYDLEYLRTCCETCALYKSNDDCPYGDNIYTDPCEYSSCITSGSDYLKRCCATCRSFTSTTTTTSTTTISTTTTTQTSTTTAPTTTTKLTTTLTTTTTTPTTTTTLTTTTTTPTTTTSTPTTTTTPAITTQTPTVVTETTTSTTTTTQTSTTTTTTTTPTTTQTTTITTPTTTTTSRTTTTTPTTTTSTPTTTTTPAITTQTLTVVTEITTLTIPTASTEQNPSASSPKPTSGVVTVSSRATTILAPTPCYVVAGIVVSIFVAIVGDRK